MPEEFSLCNSSSAVLARWGGRGTKSFSPEPWDTVHWPINSQVQFLSEVLLNGCSNWRNVQETQWFWGLTGFLLEWRFFAVLYYRLAFCITSVVGAGGSGGGFGCIWGRGPGSARRKGGSVNQEGRP